MPELKLTRLNITELPVNYFMFTEENIIYFRALIERNKDALLNEHLVNFDEKSPMEFVKQLTLIKGAVNVLEELIADHEEAKHKFFQQQQLSNPNSED